MSDLTVLREGGRYLLAVAVDEQTAARAAVLIRDGLSDGLADSLRNSVDMAFVTKRIRELDLPSEEPPAA